MVTARLVPLVAEKVSKVAPELGLTPAPDSPAAVSAPGSRRARIERQVTIPPHTDPGRTAAAETGVVAAGVDRGHQVARRGRAE